MDSCFNRSRCGHSLEDFRVYIYPDDTDGDEYPLERGFYWEMFLQWLHAHNLTTEDPQRACLFIPHIDFVWQLDTRDIHKRLTRLKYFGAHGQNHLVIISDDSTYPNMLRHLRVCDLGHMIVLSTSTIDRTRIRLGFDIAIPLLGPSVPKPPDSDVQVPSRLHFRQYSLDVCRRTRLASFRGSRYGNVHVRENLKKIHNPEKRMYVYTKCFVNPITWLQADTRTIDNDCAADLAHFNTSPPYLELMYSSLFGLAPRGVGYHSYRLVEIMAAGSIPVVLSDRYAMPYAPDVDLHSCVIQYPEEDVEKLTDYLRSIPFKEVVITACFSFNLWLLTSLHCTVCIYTGCTSTA